MHGHEGRGEDIGHYNHELHARLHANECQNQGRVFESREQTMRVLGKQGSSTEMETDFQAGSDSVDGAHPLRQNQVLVGDRLHWDTCIREDLPFNMWRGMRVGLDIPHL